MKTLTDKIFGSCRFHFDDIVAIRRDIHMYPETEFNAEESDLDEDFNQESEEELLDIPTFLRRQAN